MPEHYPDDGKRDPDLAETEALIMKAQQRRRDPDAYDSIIVRWSLVSEAVKVHLLFNLIHSLTPEQRQELRECCEEDMEGWGAAWD